MASKGSLVDYPHDDAVGASVTGSPEGDSSRNEAVGDKRYYNNTGSSIQEIGPLLSRRAEVNRDKLFEP